MRCFKTFFIILCLIVSIQLAHAQTYYACKGCGGYGYTNSGSSICSYCDGYGSVEENSWGYKELTSRGYNLFYTPTAKNSNGEYTRSKWNTSSGSYEKHVFKDGKFVRQEQVSSSSVNSYSGTYNNSYTGGYNRGTTETNNNRSQSTGTKHGYHTEYYYDDCSFCYGNGKCKTCLGSGVVNKIYIKYSCPNCKVPGNDYRIGNGVCAHCENGKVKKHRYVKNE